MQILLRNGSCRLITGYNHIIQNCSGHCNYPKLRLSHSIHWLSKPFVCSNSTFLLNYDSPGPYLRNVRQFSLSTIRFENNPLKPSSKVEETVQTLRKNQETALAEAPPKAVAKKSIKQRVIDEIVHYYHGFRLLFIDMKISSVLMWRVLNGKSLTRRETRLLRRTVGDMFRLVPFSVFIIVPFMEFLLPVFIKLFPGMLPSTFQTATEREDKIKQSLKVKLEMAKFLQQTLDDMSLQHKGDHNSQQAKEFSEWFHNIRTSGETVGNRDIIKFSKLFRDEITLDSLSRSQLVALCRVIEVQTLGTNNLLRFQLRMKLRSLAADDKMIEKEGVDSMTLPEVQQACRSRGMRAFGVSEERLRRQLNDWLVLSLHEKVPPSLLLLSRALMLPETIPTEDKLKATISALPDNIVVSTKAAIGEVEGKIDNKVRLEVIKEEERRIKEERQERREAEKLEKEKEAKEIKLEKEKLSKEILLDKAPTISSTTPELVDPAHIITPSGIHKPAPAVVVQLAKKTEDTLKSKDIEALEDALDHISKDKQTIVEKVEIEELKEQMADYQEDVADLRKTVATMPKKTQIKESKAAQRLFNKVNVMIGKMDKVLGDLESKEKQLKESMKGMEVVDKTKEELLRIDDIMGAIRKIKDVPDESRLAQIQQVLSKIDDDRDGSIKIEDVLKVIEFIGKENVQLNAKQIDELVELLDKEEIIEVEDKIEKALQKEKEIKESADAAAVAAAASNEPTELQLSDLTKTKPQTVEDRSTSKATSEGGSPTKPKIEAKSNISPPINSIDTPKKNNPTKTL